MEEIQKYASEYSNKKQNIRITKSSFQDKNLKKVKFNTTTIPVENAEPLSMKSKSAIIQIEKEAKSGSKVDKVSILFPPIEIDSILEYFKETSFSAEIKPTFINGGEISSKLQLDFKNLIFYYQQNKDLLISIAKMVQLKDKDGLRGVLMDPNDHRIEYTYSKHMPKKKLKIVEK